MARQDTNHITLTGRLGQDPEFKNLSSDTGVTNFSLAVSDVRKQEEVTQFIRIVAFGRLADLSSQFLSKGSAVLVEGKLQIRSYEKQDGSKGQSTEVVASRIQFLDSRKSSDSAREEDEIPF